VGTAIDATGFAVDWLPACWTRDRIGGYVYSDVIVEQFPNLSKDIVDGVGRPPRRSEDYVDAAETDLNAIGAAGSVVSSGVRGVLSHFTSREFLCAVTDPFILTFAEIEFLLASCPQRADAVRKDLRVNRARPGSGRAARGPRLAACQRAVHRGRAVRHAGAEVTA